MGFEGFFSPLVHGKDLEDAGGMNFSSQLYAKLTAFSSVLEALTGRISLL